MCTLFNISQFCNFAFQTFNLNSIHLSKETIYLKIDENNQINDSIKTKTSVKENRLKKWIERGENMGLFNF